jgi:3-deoxy-D-manno-octulosonate 8-phosphate phosphatase (KDO 8-P phosphatase)
LKKKITKKKLIDIARNIRFVIFDVDGVLTDGGIILDGKGNEIKSFHVRDGHGIKMLIRVGIKVALITGRSSRVVERRARELGITDVFQKCFNKRKAYKALAEKYSLDDHEVAYIGDDIVDIPLLQRIGLPVVVADADDEVKACALMVTKNRGGRGAAREVCDFILKAQGHWKAIIDGYFKT